AVMASDLVRARETAEIIAAEIGLDGGAASVTVDAGFRERDVGAWSGLTTEEIEAKWPGQLAAWRTGELTVIPEGEGDIEERVMAAVERVLLQPVDTVLAVTHGGVIRTAERALGVEPSMVRNVGGRWVSRDGERLVAGRVVTLRDPDTPT